MDITLLICLAALAAAPIMIRFYIRALPVAPACPCCSATTRQSYGAADALRFLPHLTATSLGECGRCGWRGRMRWKWATRIARQNRR